MNQLCEWTNILAKSHFNEMKRGNLDFSTDQSGNPMLWCTSLYRVTNFIFCENNRISKNKSLNFARSLGPRDPA